MFSPVCCVCFHVRPHSGFCYMFCQLFHFQIEQETKKQVVILPIYKFLCHSSYLPSFFGTSAVSSLVPANPTRRFRFCRSIAKILRCNPLNSTSFVVGTFQILQVSLQFSTRSGQIWSRSVKVMSRSGQIWRKTCPDLQSIKVSTREDLRRLANS